MRALLIALAVLALSACAHRPEPVIRTVEVKVPVPVACRIDLGSEPDRAQVEAVLKTGEAAEMLKWLYAYFRSDGAWHEGVKAQAKACEG